MTIIQGQFFSNFTRVKFEIFKSRKTIFYSYVVGGCISLGMLSLLMLPKALQFPNLPIHNCFRRKNSVFEMSCIHSKRNLLANFVDGFRSFVGNLFKIFAKGTSFYSFLYTEYFVPPMFTFGLLIFALLLTRERTHIGLTSTTKVSHKKL